MAIHGKWIDAARSWPRPLLGWVCLPLIPAAVIMPDIGADKLTLLLAFAGVVYGIRAAERMQERKIEAEEDERDA